MAKNSEWTSYLEDFVNDEYGERTCGDLDRIKTKLAEELIENGTIVLIGDTGMARNIIIRKRFNYIDWKKPNENIDYKERLKLVEELTDQNLLADVAKNDENCDIRLVAVDRLKNFEKIDNKNGNDSILRYSSNR
ncbi:MAG: hypothetical protein LBI15_09535 [Dysgonamonadaceae bacterium]|jgi:hypothetical protein|nr:hypothetical protein [Dysgonamonadaceae bacterium]